MQTLLYPAPSLKQKSEEVTEFDDKLENFAKRLIEHCAHCNGLGMAAPQVGNNIRLIVIMNSLYKDENYPWVMVNPIITELGGESKYKEGCLSVPGVYAWVKRCGSFKVDYQGLNGKKHELTVDQVNKDSFGTVVLHEVDHLDGIEFIDKLEPFEYGRVASKINKLRKKK